MVETWSNQQKNLQAKNEERPKLHTLHKNYIKMDHNIKHKTFKNRTKSFNLRLGKVFLDLTLERRSVK